MISTDEHDLIDMKLCARQEYKICVTRDRDGGVTVVEGITRGPALNVAAPHTDSTNIRIDPTLSIKVHDFVYPPYNCTYPYLLF